MKQLNHYDTLAKMKFIETDLILFLCGISKENLGLILRTADIFSIKKIYYLGDIPDKLAKLEKYSRGANTSIAFVNNICILDVLKSEGYRIVSLEITDESTPLRSATFEEKTCLIVGNENVGIPQDILDKSDCAYHIEMIGQHISSLNVSMSAAIAINKYVENLIYKKK